MRTPGSQALRKGRISVPGAKYIITKNARERIGDLLVKGENPGFLMHWFFTAAGRGWIDLVAFVVMPDHYHLVITLGTELSLSKAIGKINENSSRLIKRNMAFHSTFWQHGFHDHLIRSTEDMRKYIEYVHMNPVEEGLVDRPDEWPWSSVHPDHAGKVSRL